MSEGCWRFVIVTIYSSVFSTTVPENELEAHASLNYDHKYTIPISNTSA
jgi:hypothetical protein